MEGELHSHCTHCRSDCRVGGIEVAIFTNNQLRISIQILSLVKEQNSTESEDLIGIIEQFMNWAVSHLAGKSIF